MHIGDIVTMMILKIMGYMKNIKKYIKFDVIDIN